MGTESIVTRLYPVPPGLGPGKSAFKRSEDRMIVHPSKPPVTLGRKKNADIWTNFLHATHNSGVHTPLLLEGNKTLKPGSVNPWERLLLIQMQRICPQWGGHFLQHLFCCISLFLTPRGRLTNPSLPGLERCGGRFCVTSNWRISLI